MAIVLASKPGLSSTTTLHIPKDWDPTWLRNFISNQLKGADVRNAVGVNGISVTGTIASPYATISLGPGPIVLNTPAGTVALTINGAAGQDALDVKVAGTPIFSVAAGGIFANTWGSQSGIQTITAGGGLQITGTSITGKGLTANAQVDMAPDTGTFTATLTGCTTAPTGTARWAKIGNLVLLQLPAITGTSNSTGCTFTGVPSEIWTTASGGSNQSIPFIVDNSVTTNGAVSVGTSGTVQFYKGASETTASFTAAGTKGLNASVTVAYSLF
jgi:hypothetical protein